MIEPSAAGLDNTKPVANNTSTVATGHLLLDQLSHCPNAGTGIGNGVAAYACNGLNFCFGISVKEGGVIVGIVIDSIVFM